MPTEYIHFTDEQKEQARRTDLAELLRSQGETVKRSGREFEWCDGSAKVTIRGNLWFHQYDREGGGLNFGMWALVFSADMTNHWVKYIKLRLKGELLAALLYTLIVAVMSGYHIYNLIASSTIM